MRALVALAGVLLLAGCGAAATAPTPRLTVTSPAFDPGAAIPRAYTCDGRDISLPVRWSGVPGSATSLALVMRDPDAPGGNFIHWQLRGIPVSSTGLPGGRVPAGVIEGVNGFGTRGYRGPCPPHGPAHHYVITVTAQHGSQAIATGTLTGTYVRR